MIVRRVKWINEGGFRDKCFKITTIWLFGIIPIYYSKVQMPVQHIAPLTQWGYSLSNVHLLQHYNKF